MNRKIAGYTFAQNHGGIKSYGEASARQQNHERNRVEKQKQREENMKRLHGDRGDNRE